MGERQLDRFGEESNKQTKNPFSAWKVFLCDVQKDQTPKKTK